MFNDLYRLPDHPATGPFDRRAAKDIHVLRFHQALNLFNRAVSKGKTRNFLLSLLQRQRKLIHLNDLNLPLMSSYELGLRAVLISHICGTQGRMKDFDMHFYPLTERIQDRWVSVAVARLEGIGLPAVDLVQVKDKYFVQDGHHRISVARALGQEAIDANITVWKVEEE